MGDKQQLRYIIHGKKHKSNIENVYVQLKLTTIQDKENLNNVVGRIAEYANTQNKISASDLSSNQEGLIELEKNFQNNLGSTKGRPIASNKMVL